MMGNSGNGNGADREEALRQRFIRERGRWVPALDSVLHLDPDFFEAYLAFATAPMSGPLPVKYQELICIAVDAATTKLWEPGLRHHIQAALDAGATKEEILEVLELIAVLGMHTMTMGVPVLLDELQQRGIDTGLPAEAEDSALDERRQLLKEQFTRERGKWAPLLDALLRLDPEFFAAYLELAAAPWRSGTLPPKLRELIYVAIDVNTSHLYEPGFRHHLRAALDQGAAPEEILQVIELVTDIGIHSVTMGVPVLLQEVAARAAAPAS